MPLMPTLYEARFLIALALTVLVETAVLVFLARVVFKRGLPVISLPRLLFAGVFCSFATLPYLWFIAPWLFRSATPLSIVAGELSVALLEAAAYRFFLPINLGKAAIFSVACNLASVAIGLLIF